MMRGHRHVPALALARAGVLAGIASLMLLSSDKPLDSPLAAGQEASGPWWMRPTSLSPDGHFLGLKNRALWKRALDLMPGESFLVDERGLPKDRVLIRKERVKTATGETAEAIVWVIDDDEDGSLAGGGDLHADCYVVDFQCDGIVDRIVDYIGGDENGTPGEVEIRDFENGALKHVLVLKGDLAEDGPWRIAGYDLVMDRNAPLPEKVVLYMNRFDAESGRWVAAGLCPLTAVEGEGSTGSRAVYRVNASPASILDIQIGFLFGEPAAGGSGTIHTGLALTGNVSFADRAESVFHPRRRPPQETFVVPPETLIETVESFPAEETGFSWREGPDGEVEQAFDPVSAELWDDLFWTWERRSLGEAGISRRDWNIRREWSGRPSERREYYSSGVDRRIHLVGAEEGWIRIGQFAGLGDIGEIRMFDTDGNGFFDRWEFHLAGRSRPVIMSAVRDEKVRRLGSDLNDAVSFYRSEILPEAIASNKKILEAIASLHEFDLPPELKAAASGGTDAERRYAQDLLRDLAFLSLRDFVATSVAQTLLRDSREGAGNYFSSLPGIRPSGRERLRGESGLTGEQAWTIAGLLVRLEEAYGRGDYDAAAAWIARMKQAGRFE